MPNFVAPEWKNDWNIGLRTSAILCCDRASKFDPFFHLSDHFYMPDESRSYYGMARVIRLSIHLSVNIWLSTGVITCRINFNFTDIIHLLGPIHDTSNGPCSSLNMCILTQLLLFTFCRSWGHFYLSQIFTFVYCRCLHLCVCVSVCVSVTCLSAQ